MEVKFQIQSIIYWSQNQPGFLWFFFSPQHSWAGFFSQKISTLSGIPFETAETIQLSSDPGHGTQQDWSVHCPCPGVGAGPLAAVWHPQEAHGILIPAKLNRNRFQPAFTQGIPTKS